ncbi:unnamed protein product [Linum trigynum]|uniref:Uncharacterized protein n=1 Tax=Linum trigynum TaxID=586398 RepID=A0AAV2DL77_9ROSI
MLLGSYTVQTWETCSHIVGICWGDSPLSLLPIYKQLIAAGVKIWVNSGDTDSMLLVTASLQRDTSLMH